MAARLPERIEGKGLALRRWLIGDAELLDQAVLANLDHLRPWMPWVAEEPRSLAERRALLHVWEREWEDGGDVYLGVFLDEEVAGGCGLHRRGGPGTLEIGYWTHVAFLRRGVATRVAALLTDAALGVPGIGRVEIHHDRANAASAEIPRRLGYRLVGESAGTVDAPAETGIDCTWRLKR
jgi:ribosomal-protein-serine acetyltransferase